MIAKLRAERFRKEYHLPFSGSPSLTDSMICHDAMHHLLGCPPSLAGEVHVAAFTEAVGIKDCKNFDFLWGGTNRIGHLIGLFVMAIGLYAIASEARQEISKNVMKELRRGS